MILELVQEADERDVVVTARPRLEEEATAPEVPPERQAHGEGELRPVEGMDQDGGLPARGPCAADGRPLRDAALVLEDDPGPALIVPISARISPGARCDGPTSTSACWPTVLPSGIVALRASLTHGPRSPSPGARCDRSMRWADVYVCMLADGVARRTRSPQGQVDPRARLAGGPSAV